MLYMLLYAIWIRVNRRIDNSSSTSHHTADTVDVCGFNHNNICGITGITANTGCSGISGQEAKDEDGLSEAQDCAI